MVAVLLTIAAIAVTAPEVEVAVSDGSVVTGTLEKLSTEKITVTSDNGEAVISADRISSVRTLSTSPNLAPGDNPAVSVDLIDGSRLAGIGLSVDGSLVMLDCGKNRNAQFGTSRVRRIKFSRSDDTAAPAWPLNIGADATSDLVAVRKKDHVDFVDGRIVKISDTFVVLRVDGTDYPINRAKVDGVIYFHKVTADLHDPACIVEDNLGWRLKAQNISWTESLPRAPLNETGDGWLKVTLPTMPGDSFQDIFIPWSSVAKLDYSVGKVTYLSSLEPESVQWTPYLEFGNAPAALAQYYAPRRDDGREHQPIRLGGKTYNKGLSLYSRTALAYRLPAGMKKFQAIAGIDDSVRDGGNVRLEISADGKKLFDQPITGKDAPIDINLDIEGAKRLSILVDYGDDSDAGDYLNLAEARTLK
jgi:hypothetical protein